MILNGLTQENMTCIFAVHRDSLHVLKYISYNSWLCTFMNVMSCVSMNSSDRKYLITLMTGPRHAKMSIETTSVIALPKERWLCMTAPILFWNVGYFTFNIL